MAAEFDWSMHRSDTKNLIVTVKDSADVVVDLTGALEITFAATKRKEDGTFGSTPAVTKTLTGAGISITDAPNGVFQVELVTDDTKGMSIADYYYEVEVIDSGSNVGTVLIGTWTLLKDLITNA